MALRQMVANPIRHTCTRNTIPNDLAREEAVTLMPPTLANPNCRSRCSAPEKARPGGTIYGLGRNENRPINKKATH